ncbi:Glutamate--isopropylamine ligase [compost metagenome]
MSPAVARRVENRLAGADANPYLAMAATLAAGLAGLQTRCLPGDPVQGNGYDLPRGLPRTFSTAHEQMAQSEHAPRLLGERFVRAYLAVKAMEHDSFLNEISAWERRFLLPQV